MELETFIEDDIREFLDKKADKQNREQQKGYREDEVAVYSLSKDYAKEVKKELKKGNERGAQQYYKQLLQEYKSFPKGSQARETAYSVMREVKKLFKQAGIGDKIKLPESPQGSSYEQRREEQINRLKRQKRLKDKLVNKIHNDIERVSNLLDEGDPLAAVYIYKDAKRLFRRIPSRFKHVREDIYDELITCYYQISKRTGSKPEEILEHDEEESDHAPILSHMQDIRQLIQKKQLERATEEYKQLTQELKEYNGSQRDELIKDAHALRESLQKAQETNMQRKQRSPPEKAIKQHVDEEDINEAIKRGKRKAYNYLKNGNPSSAMKQYNKLKQYYDQLDGDDKQRFYKSLMSLHKAIMHAKKQQWSEATETDKDNKYWDEINTIKELLDKDKIQEAQQQYLDLQSELLETEGEEREDLHEAIHDVKRRLNAHKSNQEERVNDD